MTSEGKSCRLSWNDLHFAYANVTTNRAIEGQVSASDGAVSLCCDE